MPVGELNPFPVVAIRLRGVSVPVRLVSCDWIAGMAYPVCGCRLLFFHYRQGQFFSLCPLWGFLCLLLFRIDWMPYCQQHFFLIKPAEKNPSDSLFACFRSFHIRSFCYKDTTWQKLAGYLWSLLVAFCLLWLFLVILNRIWPMKFPRYDFFKVGKQPETESFSRYQDRI